jgi:hypothetical protein
MLNRLPGRVWSAPRLPSRTDRPLIPGLSGRRSGIVPAQAQPLRARALAQMPGAPTILLPTKRRFDTPYISNYADETELGAAPANPPSGVMRFYAKNDHTFHALSSSGTDTSLGAGGGGGGDAMIQTQTASGVASLDFETGLDDTYDAFELRFSSLAPATDDVQLMFQVKSAGSYQTTGYLCGLSLVTSNGSPVDTSSTSAIVATNATATNMVGNASGETISGVVRFNDPEVTTNFINFEGHSSWRRADNLQASAHFGGFYNTVGAITGVRVKFSSGNIASGRCTLYGYKKA